MAIARRNVVEKRNIRIKPGEPSDLGNSVTVGALGLGRFFSRVPFVHPRVVVFVGETQVPHNMREIFRNALMLIQVKLNEHVAREQPAGPLLVPLLEFDEPLVSLGGPSLAWVQVIKTMTLKALPTNAAEVSLLHGAPVSHRVHPRLVTPRCHDEQDLVWLVRSDEIACHGDVRSKKVVHVEAVSLAIRLGHREVEWLQAHVHGTIHLGSRISGARAHAMFVK
mmetsp:Transcript_12478/g.31799  ORF Transcript_12478/g.31799 Transcript_12478/m.31799 type:complete len:223 (-) Transcript_12478:1597-2265(-)